MLEYKVAVIVINYNDEKTTRKFLESIRGYSAVFKIIVVDNCSTDDSYECLKKYSDNIVEVIRTQSNVGYAKGNNYGAFYAMRKYNPDCIVISNPDVEFDEKYLSTVVDAAMKLEKAGLVSGVMHSLANIRSPQIAWRLPGYTDLLLSNFILLRRLIGNRGEYKKFELEQDTIRVDVIPGSFFAVRASVFNEIGGFGEDTFLYEEENIISYKIKKAGYFNYLLTNISYLHVHASSINKEVPAVSKRLDIDFASRMIYAESCLKINRIQRYILSMTYQLGKFNYLFALKILKIRR